MSAGGAALAVLSSMATKEMLAELVERWNGLGGAQVKVESIAGVEAARRVRAGEACDVVILAEDAVASLEAAGHVMDGSAIAIAASSVAVAVRTGAAKIDLSSEDTLKAAVLAARSIGYSTGPSGAHLASLLERWGVSQSVAPRLVQAPPGVPVASLVASGEAALGFQQLSELVHAPGITVLGVLPPGAQRITLFSGAVCARSAEPGAARSFLAWLASPVADESKRRHGMEPAAHHARTG